VGDVELHLLQGLGEKDVEPASTIDEDLVEPGARDHRLEDEREPPLLLLSSNLGTRFRLRG
jgi:hypothetical protein